MARPITELTCSRRCQACFGDHLAEALVHIILVFYGCACHVQHHQFDGIVGYCCRCC
ncbi:MAG: hypothetical protein Q8P67_26435 [archaeon]|nr:hypothetical protein [archaeon]